MHANTLEEYESQRSKEIVKDRAHSCNYTKIILLRFYQQNRGIAPTSQKTCGTVAYFTLVRYQIFRGRQERSFEEFS